MLPSRRRPGGDHLLAGGAPDIATEALQVEGGISIVFRSVKYVWCLTGHGTGGARQSEGGVQSRRRGCAGPARPMNDGVCRAPQYDLAGVPLHLSGDTLPPLAGGALLVAEGMSAGK